jgi:hypothetical protein
VSLAVSSGPRVIPSLSFRASLNAAFATFKLESADKLQRQKKFFEVYKKENDNFESKWLRLQTEHDQCEPLLAKERQSSKDHRGCSSKFDKLTKELGELKEAHVGCGPALALERQKSIAHRDCPSEILKLTEEVNFLRTEREEALLAQASSAVGPYEEEIGGGSGEDVGDGVEASLSNRTSVPAPDPVPILANHEDCERRLEAAVGAHTSRVELLERDSDELRRLLRESSTGQLSLSLKNQVKALTETQEELFSTNTNLENQVANATSTIGKLQDDLKKSYEGRGQLDQKFDQIKLESSGHEQRHRDTHEQLTTLTGQFKQLMLSLNTMCRQAQLSADFTV